MRNSTWNPLKNGLRGDVDPKPMNAKLKKDGPYIAIPIKNPINNGPRTMTKSIIPPPAREKNFFLYHVKTPSALVPSLSTISRPIPNRAPIATKKGAKSGVAIKIAPTARLAISNPLVGSNELKNATNPSMPFVAKKSGTKIRIATKTRSMSEIIKTPNIAST